jgi:hypothetical protein
MYIVVYPFIRDPYLPLLLLCIEPRHVLLEVTDDDNELTGSEHEVAVN